MERICLRKLVPLLAALLATVATAVSCEKDKEMTVSNVETTECLLHGQDQEKGWCNPDSVSVRYSNGTVFVTHYNLGVNCGFERVDVGVNVQSNTMTITENEVTPIQANCDCEVNNSFQINNVKPGTYTLVFENWIGGNRPYSQTFNF